MKRKSITYYVSSVNGKDTNDGLTQETPFRTLHQVSEREPGAGDRILLERGSVFEDQYLHIRGKGEKGNLIEIAPYGEGNLPHICANGTGIWYQDYGTRLDSPAHVYQGNVSSAVLLYDADYIWIHDLEISNKDNLTRETTERTKTGQDVSGFQNIMEKSARREDSNSQNIIVEGCEKADCEKINQYSAPHKMDRTGVAVVAQNGGTLHEITLQNLMIHDVNGNVYNKHMNNGGIYMTALKPENEEQTGVARYDGIKVENCCVWNVSRWGIAVGYTYQHARFTGAKLQEECFLQYGHENIILRNNYVKNAGGDAITPMYALRPLVEHNISDSCAAEMNDRIYRYAGNRMGKVAAAIWPWKCKDALFRFNEAVDTRLNQDGMAYDADSGDGTIYEYNYSRLNEGGCVMFCLEEAIHNTFRKNVSYDDLGGILSPSGNPDAYVTENQFYIRKGVPLLRKNMSDGEVTLRNNIITELK